MGDIWRFLPVFDPGVNVMVSRDMDSLLTSREAQAVTQWLEETSLPFHVMRYLILDSKLDLEFELKLFQKILN